MQNGTYRGDLPPSLYGVKSQARDSNWPTTPPSVTFDVFRAVISDSDWRVRHIRFVREEVPILPRWFVLR